MYSEQWSAQKPQQFVLKIACSWSPQANGETMNRTKAAKDVSTLAVDGGKHGFGSFKEIPAGDENVTPNTNVAVITNRSTVGLEIEYDA